MSRDNQLMRAGNEKISETLLRSLTNHKNMRIRVPAVANPSISEATLMVMRNV